MQQRQHWIDSDEVDAERMVKRRQTRNRAQASAIIRCRARGPSSIAAAWDGETIAFQTDAAPQYHNSPNIWLTSGRRGEIILDDPAIAGKGIASAWGASEQLM